MSFVENLHNFIEKKLYDGVFYNIEDKIEQLDKSNIYPISQYQAFQIANKNCNLKTDYKKNADKCIVSLDFSDFKIDLINSNNKKKYWLIKITEGDYKYVTPYYDEEDDDDDILFRSDVSAHRFLDKKDLKKLQCLIDVNTGEYIYYPKK